MAASSRRPSGKAKRSSGGSRKPPGGTIIARPELQRYGMGGPRTSYEDVQRLCIRCLRPFAFSAQEQQHWYETLRFTIDSIPNECAPCRLFLRRARRAQDRLTTLLTDPRPETAEEMMEAALLLALLGRKKRAQELHNRARNRLGQEPPQRKVAALAAKYQLALDTPELEPALAPPLRCHTRHLHLLFVVIHEAWIHDRRLPQSDLAMRLLESHRYQCVGRWRAARAGNPKSLRADLESGGYSYALLIMYEALGAFREPGQERTAEDTSLLAALRANLPLTPESAAEQLHAMCGSLGAKAR
jgi:hypothetical protein